MRIEEITLQNIISSNQPRPLITAEVDKLAASIKEVGLIQPITVRDAVVIRGGTTQQGWQIVAGHHRVAACRALGWTFISALVIADAGHLQSELMEIDENLCRAELTASQRTGYTKRRKQIWEALNPPAATQRFDSVFDAIGDLTESGTTCPTLDKPSTGRGNTQFASETSAITGQSKRDINRAIARADALGDEALTKVTNTSLDSGVELDALAKMPAPERSELIERAAAGEQVSARAQAAPVSSKPAPDRHLPIKLYKAVQALLKTMGCNSADDLVDEINKLPELTEAEQSTLDDALNDLTAIGTLMGATA